MSPCPETLPPVSSGIAVIIAARNAERTIGTAVRSALDEPEVIEVIVVDDASGDGTARAARETDDGSGRLHVIQRPVNGGPAAARNLALDCSNAPFFAILDADDMFLTGRFAAMGLAGGALPDTCDAAADNIAFVPPDGMYDIRLLNRTDGTLDCTLNLEQLVLGNISRPGRPRGELGFLKPVFSRRFVEQHGLRYNPGLRLGEDFEFTVRFLAAGGRFRITQICGYLAVEHSNSLSAAHSAADLAALAAADQQMLRTLSLGAAELDALLRHHAHVQAKCDHRRFLDAKRAHGLLAALGLFGGDLLQLGRVLRAVARDKLRAEPPPLRDMRMLIDVDAP